VANKKISRKELLKSPDEFLTLSSKAAAYFSAHLRELKIAGIAVAVILVGYVSVYGYLRYANVKGQETYNLAYDVLTKNPTLSQPSDAAATPDTEDLKKAEALFQQVIDDYSISKAARVALAQVGHIRFSQKEYDEAIVYFERFAKEMSGHKEYQDLASLAQASCYEAKGEFKKAISILTPLVDTPTNPFRETAMLSLERVYRLDNQADKARDILTRFVQEYQTSPFLPMAKARL